jgi:hypothetical protein
MEVLGRPRLDEQGRRFNYKRCTVCGFALRHFLDAVGTILPTQPMDSRLRRGPGGKEMGKPGGPAGPPPPIVSRRPGVLGRLVAPSRHVPPKPTVVRPHPPEVAPKSGPARRRR